MRKVRMGKEVVKIALVAYEKTKWGQYFCT